MNKLEEILEDPNTLFFVMNITLIVISVITIATLVYYFYKMIITERKEEKEKLNRAKVVKDCKHHYQIEYMMGEEIYACCKCGDVI